MRRECTEAENRIIRDSLTDTTLFETNTSNILPVVLGFFLGLAVSIPIAFAVRNAGEAAVALVLVVCTPVMTNGCYFVWRRFGEKIGRRKRRRRTFKDGTFQVNGGTVTGYFGGGEDAWLEFAEDDLLDSEGKPYIVSFAVQIFPEVKPGDRILLVYCDTGEYIPMPVSEETQGMISMQAPDYWDKADKTKLTSIPHPNVTCLDREAYRMNEQEATALAKKCNEHRGMKAKNIVGIILLSVLVLMIFGIVFIFLVAGEVIESLSVACTVAGIMLVVWGLSTYGIARGIRGSLTKSIRKLEYKKRVLFHSIMTDLGDNTLEKELKVYEYVNGQLDLVTYSVNSNVYLPKNVRFGTVIYKYSRNAEEDKPYWIYFCL